MLPRGRATNRYNTFKLGKFESSLNMKSGNMPLTTFKVYKVALNKRTKTILFQYTIVYGMCPYVNVCALCYSLCTLFKPFNSLNSTHMHILYSMFSNKSKGVITDYIELNSYLNVSVFSMLSGELCHFHSDSNTTA